MDKSTGRNGFYATMRRHITTSTSFIVNTQVVTRNTTPGQTSRSISASTKVYDRLSATSAESSTSPSGIWPSTRRRVVRLPQIRNRHQLLYSMSRPKRRKKGRTKKEAALRSSALSRPTQDQRTPPMRRRSPIR